MSFSQLKSQTRCYGFRAPTYTLIPVCTRLRGREYKETRKEEKQFGKKKLEKFVSLNLVESAEHVDSDLLNFIGLQLQRPTKERERRKC